MINRKIKPILLTLCGFLVTSILYAQNVQAILNQYRDSIKDFGIVALVDNGAKADVGAIGYSHKDVPIALNNRFCIGSVTKMYTSVMILKLQEKGKLNINDSLYRYYQDIPLLIVQ